MLAHFGGNVCTLAEVADKKLAAAVLSSDPMRPHNVDERVKALLGIPAIVPPGDAPGGPLRARHLEPADVFVGREVGRL